MLLLAVKVLLAPSFVVLASLAGRRFGMRVSGFVGGMPFVAGPILLAYALQHGRGFAAHAATGTLLGLVSLMGFVVAYGRLARRLPWHLSLPLGWLAFGAATALFTLLPSSPPLALGIVALALATAPLLLPRLSRRGLGPDTPSESGPDTPSSAPGPYTPLSDLDAPGPDTPPREPEASALDSHPAWDLPLRASSTLALVLALTAAAGWLGPHLSGLLAPFPVVASVLASFTHGQRGAGELIHLLRGLLLGYAAFGLFCFTLAVSLGPLPIADAFGLASLAAMLCQSSVLAWHRIRSTRAAAATAADPARA